MCSCFNVYEQDIINEIMNNGASTVEMLGEALKCCTNCGSCKTELSALIVTQFIPIKTLEDKPETVVA